MSSDELTMSSWRDADRTSRLWRLARHSRTHGLSSTRLLFLTAWLVPAAHSLARPSHSRAGRRPSTSLGGARPAQAARTARARRATTFAVVHACAQRARLSTRARAEAGRGWAPRQDDLAGALPLRSLQRPLGRNRQLSLRPIHPP